MVRRRNACLRIVFLYFQLTFPTFYLNLIGCVPECIISEKNFMFLCKLYKDVSSCATAPIKPSSTFYNTTESLNNGYHSDIATFLFSTKTGSLYWFAAPGVFQLERVMKSFHDMAIGILPWNRDIFLPIWFHSKSKADFRVLVQSNKLFPLLNDACFVYS